MSVNTPKLSQYIILYVLTIYTIDLCVCVRTIVWVCMSVSACESSRSQFSIQSLFLVLSWTSTRVEPIALDSQIYNTHTRETYAVIYTHICTYYIQTIYTHTHDIYKRWSPRAGLVFDAYLPNQNLPVRINSIDIAHISISINMLCQCCPLQKQKKKTICS